MLYISTSQTKNYTSTVGKEGKEGVEADFVVAWDVGLIGGQTDMQWGDGQGGWGFVLVMVAFDELLLYIFYQHLWHEHVIWTSLCKLDLRCALWYLRRTFCEHMRAKNALVWILINIRTITVIMASINMSNLSYLPIFKKLTFFEKKWKSGIRQMAATCGPAIGCFAHQNKLVLLWHKQTHIHTLLCIYPLILFHWGKAACCTHTRPGVGATGSLPTSWGFQTNN